MLSSKCLDYTDWSKAVKLILSDKYYTSKGIIEKDIILNDINRKRVYFNWDHLNNI